MSKSDRGFTLTELLVSIAIASILATIALGASLNQIRKAQRVEAFAAMREVAIDIEEYRAKNDRYPADVQPNLKPDGIPSFRLRPDVPGERSAYDYDNHCLAGKRVIKLIWYGFNRIREDDYREAVSDETGDDAVVLVSAIDDC